MPPSPERHVRPHVSDNWFQCIVTTANIDIVHLLRFLQWRHNIVDDYLLSLGEMSNSCKTQATMGHDERKSVPIQKCSSFVSPKVQGS